MSEATYLNQTTFVWQHIDKVAVKGRHEPLNIYEPLGYSQDALPALLVEIEEYNKALVFYYQQQWAAAQEMFQTLVQRYPSRYLYQMYGMRIAELINKPMLPDWDRAFIHTHK